MQRKFSGASPARRFLSLGRYDRGIITGAALAIFIMFAAIAWGGRAANFIDIPSFLLVIGGTLAATLIHYSVEDLGHAWRASREAAKVRSYDPFERIRYLVRLAQAVKAQGLMLLERESQYVDDPFLKMALELTVDNQPADEIRRILETERRTANDQAARAVHVFETMGAYAPALGLIGTLIGLIQMLGALQNAAAVGPAMSLALVTTLYGAIAANLIFIPLAGKLRNRAEEQALLKALTIEGTLSLAKVEGSIIMEQKLQSYLPRIAA